MKFKVYPNSWITPNDKFYWQIEVRKSKRAMRRRCNLLNGDPIKDNYEAIVLPQYTYEKLDCGRKIELPTLGYVIFNNQKITPEIIAHEAVHMATGFLRRIRVSMNLGSQTEINEEKLAYAVSSCAKQLDERLM